MYTLDTNILVYATDEAFPLHRQARRLRDRAARDEEAVLCYPVLLEFFAVVTDPRRVENPLAPGEAWEEVERYLGAFQVLYPRPRTLRLLGELVRQYEITRQGIFDALVVALMLDHGVEELYTANETDFRQFEEIELGEWR